MQISSDTGHVRAHLLRVLVAVTLATLLASCGGGSTAPDEAPLDGKRYSFGAASVAPSAVSLFLGQVTFDGMPASIGPTKFAKVSERRVTRTVYEYVFKVTVLNAGGNTEGIALSLTKAPEGVTVMDGAVNVGDLAGSASKTPDDTITIQQDRLVPFEPSAFLWTLAINAGTVASVQVNVDPGTPIGLIPLLAADFSGQPNLTGTPVTVRRLRSPSLDGLLQQDGSVHKLVRRPDDAFQIEMNRQPFGSGLKVMLTVAGYGAEDFNRGEMPVAMAISNSEDEDDAFVPLETHTDPATLKAAAVIPPELFGRLPNGRYAATLRLAILKASAPAVDQGTLSVRRGKLSSGRGAALATAASSAPQIDCPVDYQVNGAGKRSCIEVSMQGVRVSGFDSLGFPEFRPHDGIDLRSKDKGASQSLAKVLGVPKARVIAYRTVEDAKALPKNRTGAMVRLQLGAYTYDYYHLGFLVPAIDDQCFWYFSYNTQTRMWYQGQNDSPCDLVLGETDALRYIGIAGGTGAGGPGNEHLHLKIYSAGTNVCYGIWCALVDNVIDPFPSLLAKLAFTSPAATTTPPATATVLDTFTFGVKGEDFKGQPVLSDIEHPKNIVPPWGNQRFLCLNDSAGTGAAPILSFEGDYQLERWVPAFLIPGIELPPDLGADIQHYEFTELEKNTKCKQWTGASQLPEYFSVKATSAGTTVLSIHYTDQRVERTPLALPLLSSAVVVVTADGPVWDDRCYLFQPDWLYCYDKPISSPGPIALVFRERFFKVGLNGFYSSVQTYRVDGNTLHNKEGVDHRVDESGQTVSWGKYAWKLNGEYVSAYRSYKTSDGGATYYGWEGGHNGMRLGDPLLQERFDFSLWCYSWAPQNNYFREDQFWGIYFINRKERYFVPTDECDQKTSYATVSTINALDYRQYPLYKSRIGTTSSVVRRRLND